MAEASCVLMEDDVLCPICLDVLTCPVTTSCGHNFCSACLSQHWALGPPWRCPLCKASFAVRPELKVNTFIKEMVAQFLKRSQQRPAPQGAGAGEVTCDLCSGVKVKALKSCLVCLVSYCEAHLRPHQTVPGLQKHQLIDPVEDLEGRVCAEHHRVLDLFCRTDRAYVCSICAVTQHKAHEPVPLGLEYERQRDALDDQIQKLIDERHMFIGVFNNSIELSQRSAVRRSAEGAEVFGGLRELVERGLEDLLRSIEETQGAGQEVLEPKIKELEEEVQVLKERRAQLMEVPPPGDFLQPLQSLQAMNVHRSLRRSWQGVSFQPPFQEGSVVRAVAQLEARISQQLRTLVEDDLQRARRYAVNLTFDPETAHPWLILSGDRKQVSPGEEKQDVPENPRRFSLNPCVLGKQGFSSGRFYFEVQVRGKKEWDLGVASESINRKEDVPVSPEDGYWAIWLRKGRKFKALSNPPVCLQLRSKPATLGVFVDYNEGLVSFYDVDVPALIYCFTRCSFKDKLFPYFNPGLRAGDKNSGPLVLSSPAPPPGC